MNKTKIYAKGFTKGFIIATFLSSALLYAGTLVDGIYQFAGGEVISASEMNYNFQQIRGNVLVEATNDTALNAQLDSMAQQCENTVTDCISGYVSLGNVSAGTIETRTDPSASALQSATATGDMNFITIPADGFYEITMIATPGTISMTPPDENWEQASVYYNFAVVKFDATDPTKGEVTSNTSAMKEPNIDGVSATSAPLYSYSSYSRIDNNGDGTEDEINDYANNGLKKEIYLKANEGVALFYWIYFPNGGGTPVGTDNIDFPIGSIKFKVKQIVD